MFKYSTKKKQLYYDKVIRLYADEHLSPGRIAKILPIARSSISAWIREFIAENSQYKSISTIGTKKSLYYDQVIHLYADEHLGKRRIAKILPLGENTISTWIRNFVAENPQYRSYKMVKKSIESSRVQAANAPEEAGRSDASSQEVESLRRELREMRRKLEDAEMKAAIYDEMINVAEDMFKIPIRKKAGTK